MRHVGPLWLLALTVMLLVGWSSSALALGLDYPAGPISGQFDWPKGLVALVNTPGRVQGYWINQNDYFHYEATTTTLNKFLTQYATLSETPLSLVLHTGEVPLTGLLGEKRNKRYDWRLRIARRGWGPAPDPNPSLMEPIPGYVVTVDVWLTDHVTLTELAVPNNVTVSSNGDIEGFIAKRKKPN